MTTFEQSFEGFIFERCGQFRDSDDPVYEMASKEAANLYSELKELLGPKGQKLLFQLDAAHGTLLGLTKAHAYQTGLKEGVQLRQILGLVC